MPKLTADLEEQIRLARITVWENQLNGFTDEALKPLLRSINQAQREIMAELETKMSPYFPDWDEGRALTMIDELGAMTAAIQAHLTNQISEMAGHAGSASLTTHGNILSWDGRVPIQSVALTAAQVRSLALDTPVGGRLLQDWVGRTFDKNLVDGIKQEITTGMLKGEDYPDIIDRISDGWNLTRTEATTLARTYVQSANVGAMQSVYKANQDIVKGERWCATLEIGGKAGGGTCLVCAALDGTEYIYPDKPPDCPKHPRCRCVLLPITKTWRELGLNVPEMEQVYRPWTTSEYAIHEGRAGEIETMGFHQGAFSKLFPKMSRDEQLAVVGPGRLELIEAKKVKFADLVDPDTGRLRLLKKVKGQVIGLRGLGADSGMGGLL